jgi:hypothetical protein
MITRVWYSVRNGGDGSAYPIFFEDELCTEIDQKLQTEGWGETCNGFLSIKHDGPIDVLDITTRKEFIKELKERLEYDSDMINEIQEAIIKLEN